MLSTLRLRPRSVTAVGVARPGRAGAAATPEARVVAVEVGAPKSACRVVGAGSTQVLGRRLRGDGAVLALHLVVELAEVALRRGVARDLEAVDVDHRDDDRPGVLHDPASPSVGAVVLEQVVSELHRVLRGRPLARVVGAELQVDRLAVVDVVRVGGDLDAPNLAALDRLVLQGQRLDQVLVAPGQLGHLVVVVSEVPVRRTPARQRRLRNGRGVLPVLRSVGLVPGRQVRDLDVVVEPRIAQARGVLRAVQHHLDAGGVAVLGHVEAELADLGAGLWRPRLDVDDLHLAVLLLAGADQRIVRSRTGGDRQRRGCEDECAKTGGSGEEPSLLPVRGGRGVVSGHAGASRAASPPEARVPPKTLPGNLSRPGSWCNRSAGHDLCTWFRQAAPTCQEAPCRTQPSPTSSARAPASATTPTRCRE